MNSISQEAVRIRRYRVKKKRERYQRIEVYLSRNVMDELYRLSALARTEFPSVSARIAWAVMLSDSFFDKGGKGLFQTVKRVLAGFFGRRKADNACAEDRREDKKTLDVYLHEDVVKAVFSVSDRADTAFNSLSERMEWTVLAAGRALSKSKPRKKASVLRRARAFFLGG